MMTCPTFRGVLSRISWRLGDPVWWIQCMIGARDGDFAARVRRRILFDRNPLFITLVDKYAVSAVAAAKGIATSKLLHITDSAESLLELDLPDNCFIKANHGSGWNIRRSEGRFVLFADGSRIQHAGTVVGELTREQTVDCCRAWLGRKWHRREWAYQQVRPRILVEETLKPSDDGELRDFRFYTFNGSVKAISIGSPTYRSQGLNVFFYPDWHVIPLESGSITLPDPLPVRPALLDDMIAAAEALGAGIDFVRVDLYDTDQGIRLGEITIYPESGYRDTPTKSRLFNRWLGNQWK